MYLKELIELSNSHIKVIISPRVGGSIYAMQYKLGDKWVDIMRPTPKEALQAGNPSPFSSFNLIPYSNRIEKAVLRYSGKEYRLKVNNDDGHAIHGEMRTRPLDIKAEGDNQIILSLDSRDFSDIIWPFPFYSEIKYAISENSFTMDLMLENVGDEIMPCGMGIHPYFMRKLNDKDDKVILKMQNIGVYPGETCIPTGHWIDVPEYMDFRQGQELSSDFLDRCFRIEHDDITIEWPKNGITLKMVFDEIFKHCIVYCPPDKPGYFAVEPVTNANNAFNMDEEGIEDTGSIYLSPGEKVNGRIVMDISSSFR